ncbi:MAG: trimeric intracellular cation channel family protein [Hahellaceae bacterium]|nr:trimeric intracellular cation channel family protein [Hahellaceae bacterium]MCP5212762.1 trimeric intracellular cation channel family protein [Hahellaceae bacterium]
MNWLLVLDLFGVFVFALSGGFDAAKYKLDILGIMVLAIATGVGGGIMRDVLLGVNPPAAFTNETYLLVCLAGGLVVFFFANRVEKHYDWVRYADAIGLGVFAAIGAAKAIDYGLGWVGVLMISTMTATGGGLIRDLLVREIPMILRADFYASAAIIGGLTFLLAHRLGLDVQIQTALSALTAIAARLLAMRYGLSLPKARGSK